MNGHEADDSVERKSGLNDPRALDILTTEHWSLLSTRTLGYQEMLGRATIYIAILSGIVVALSFLAQATAFRRQTLWFALMLLSVALFIGLTTFVRCVVINYEDARWVTGMDLLRNAYMEIVPEVEPFFVTGHEARADAQSLGYGSRQRLGNLANSLTTTSGVVAALNSVLAGSIAGDVAALFGAGIAINASVGAAVSLVSAALHVRHAARFRRSHEPTATPASTSPPPRRRNRSG